MALVGYDVLIRPRLREWGATADERARRLPGDDIVEPVMTHDTKALTIDARPDVVWPWLVQIGDHRAGFYSYDWIERFVFPGTVHYVERNHSATRIHPELQHVSVGDRINTGPSGGSFSAIRSRSSSRTMRSSSAVGRSFSSRCPASARGCSFANARWGGCGCLRRGGSGCARWADSWPT